VSCVGPENMSPAPPSSSVVDLYSLPSR
jgi:hypothetical protein